MSIRNEGRIVFYFFQYSTIGIMIEDIINDNDYDDVDDNDNIDL